MSLIEWNGRWGLGNGGGGPAQRISCYTSSNDLIISPLETWTKIVHDGPFYRNMWINRVCNRENKNQLYISKFPTHWMSLFRGMPFNQRNFFVPSFIKRARNSFFVTKYPESYQSNTIQSWKEKWEINLTKGWEDVRGELFALAVKETLLYTARAWQTQNMCLSLCLVLLGD